jgi:hypothetical protein
MAWVAEITGFDITAGATKTLLFSLGQGIAFKDADYCPGAMTRWASATQKISFDANGQVVSGGDAGALELRNLPDDAYSPGPLDALAEWAWQGRVASLYWVPGQLWSQRSLMGRGVLEQPVATLAVGNADDAKLAFPIRDPRSSLVAPIQTKKFGGTNAGPDGVDGTADLKGQPEPIIYGMVSNITPICVNPDKLIYKIADVAVLIMCVRDGSLPIGPVFHRANTASLEANVPAPGHYDWVADATGTYFRLGSPAIARLTFDAAEGGIRANRSHAQIWKRIRSERCHTPIGDLDVGDTDSLDLDQVGFYWSENPNQSDALDQLLASLSGFEYQDQDGIWHLRQLRAPTGAAVVNFMVMTEESTLRQIDRPIIDLTRVRPNYAPNGAPPYSVTVNWGYNYSVMSQGDFLGAAQQRLVDKFGKAWRTETATDPTIWNPETNTGLFPNAPELTINTGYVPGDDGLTAPHVAIEAQRLMDLYSGLKGQYQVKYTPDVGDFLMPGQTATLTHPTYGLAGGPKFIILQASFVVDSQRAASEVTIGLQT